MKVYLYRAHDEMRDCAADLFDADGKRLAGWFSSSLEWAKRDLSRCVPEGAEVVVVIGETELFRLIESGEITGKCRDVGSIYDRYRVERLDVRAPPKDERTRGLSDRYQVVRLDGSSAPGGKHHGCPYFVLDVKHDRFAGPALHAYADACEAEYPQLAADLRKLADKAWTS